MRISSYLRGFAIESGGQRGGSRAFGARLGRVSRAVGRRHRGARARARVINQRGNARRAGVALTWARASPGWGSRGNRTRRRLRGRVGAHGASGEAASRREGAAAARGAGTRVGSAEEKCNTLLNTRVGAHLPGASVRDLHPFGVWGASVGTGDIIASSYDGGAFLSGVNGISTTMLSASLRASFASVASRTGDRGPSLRSCTAVRRCTSRYDGGECGCRGTSTAANDSWSLGAGISPHARDSAARRHH